MPEDMGIFANLTVEENMRVAMLAEDDAAGERLEHTLDMFKDLKNFRPSPNLIWLAADFHLQI